MLGRVIFVGPIENIPDSAIDFLQPSFILGAVEQNFRNLGDSHVVERDIPLLPFRVAIIGGTHALVFWQDQKTYDVRYIYVIDWLRFHGGGGKSKKLFKMTYIKPWSAEEFEECLEAGVTDIDTDSTGWARMDLYRELKRQNPDYFYMDMFEGGFELMHWKLDCERYNDKVNELDLPYVDDISLSAALPDIIEEIENYLYQYRDSI